MPLISFFDYIYFIHAVYTFLSKCNYLGVIQVSCPDQIAKSIYEYWIYNHAHIIENSDRGVTLVLSIRYFAVESIQVALHFYHDNWISHPPIYRESVMHPRPIHACAGIQDTHGHSLLSNAPALKVCCHWPTLTTGFDYSTGKVW